MKTSAAQLQPEEPAIADVRDEAVPRLVEAAQDLDDLGNSQQSGPCAVVADRRPGDPLHRDGPPCRTVRLGHPLQQRQHHLDDRQVVEPMVADLHAVGVDHDSGLGPDPLGPEAGAEVGGNHTDPQDAIRIVEQGADAGIAEGAEVDPGELGMALGERGLAQQVGEDRHAQPLGELDDGLGQPVAADSHPDIDAPGGWRREASRRSRRPPRRSPPRSLRRAAHPNSAAAAQADSETDTATRSRGISR